jgi:hypothetical protein
MRRLCAIEDTYRAEENAKRAGNLTFPARLRCPDLADCLGRARAVAGRRNGWVGAA